MSFLLTNLTVGDVEVDTKKNTKESTPLLSDGSKKENTRPNPLSILKADWKRLFILAKPEWPILFIGTIALFIGSAIFLVIPAASGIIVNAVVDTETEPKVCYFSFCANILVFVFFYLLMSLVFC